MPWQLWALRVMLVLMPVWSLYSVPRMIRWENFHLFGVVDVLFMLWLLLPGGVALVCALLLGRGGGVVLYVVAGLCVVIVGLNIWSHEFGGPPVLQAIPFTVLTAIPLCFPLSWRYVRARREWRRGSSFRGGE
ncbi:hypothetical protein [Nocardiopsis sp. NPDC006832]|uniref:hypothetical protein n=1 Tax=Nocardiopsis sp. NPDC006832 TaxID=3157188 RepID=UPI0034110F92